MTTRTPLPKNNQQQKVKNQINLKTQQQINQTQKSKPQAQTHYQRSNPNHKGTKKSASRHHCNPYRKLCHAMPTIETPIRHNSNMTTVNDDNVVIVIVKKEFSKNLE